MAEFKFVLNTAGVGELLKSSEMVSLISSYADQQAAELGGESSVFIGFDRVHGVVRGAGDDRENDT